ncbi:ketoacyl-ACP synthase III [Cryptosporangium japonicum]|uniref:Ketoacyl-ACP synthase III n=1 Tax=Cryptosporangium japonicum TaxID=80872 RepID=A0ABN0TJW9_9ACTN
MSTGAYLPERVVTNEELADRVPGVTADWIERKTAIRARRFAAPDEATSDLAAAAARQALARAELSPGQINYLIVSTSTGDFPQPPTSSIVQQKIDALAAACFDVNVVCAGFVFGVELGRALVSANPGARALVVAADVYSRILDFDDRRTAVLFGDGAGAVVIGEVADGSGILDLELSTHGEAQDLVKVPAGGSRRPTSAATVARGEHFFTMQGREVREFVLEKVPPALEKLCGRAGVELSDIDCFVPHQANGVLLDQLVQRAGLGHLYTHYTCGKYGNVGSASVPIALDDAVVSGRVVGGDLVLLSAIGGGISVGTCLARWPVEVPAGAGR